MARRRRSCEASRDNLRERAVSSAQFYTTEADRYSKQISLLEGKLADFKAKNFGQLPELTRREPEHRWIAPSATWRTSRCSSQNLRQNRIFLAQQIEQARSASPDANLLSELEAEYARKQAIYDPDHPDLINLRRQIESLRRGGPGDLGHVPAAAARSAEGDPLARPASATARITRT